MKRHWEWLLFFQPTFRGGLCLKNCFPSTPPTKRTAWGFGERKRGRFLEVSAKKMRCAGRHLDILDIHMDSLNALSPMEFSIFVVVFTVLKVELLPGDLRFAQILLSSSSSWEDQDRKCELVCDVICFAKQESCSRTTPKGCFSMMLNDCLL